MPFELFNPDGDLRITRGNLPDWYQSGAIYFVTFRTADFRSAEQFVRFQRDIADNGPNAGLPAKDYLHWVRPKSRQTNRVTP